MLTTHYMEEAERLCDRVAIVDHGHVIALGSPQELIDVRRCFAPAASGAEENLGDARGCFRVADGQDSAR